MAGRASKAKGRRLQNWVRDKLLALFSLSYNYLGLQEDDIKSQTMGMTGEDIVLTPRAREYLPYSFECKNTERLNVWSAFEQCKKNCPVPTNPILVIKRNRTEPLVVMEWDLYEYYLELELDKTK